MSTKPGATMLSAAQMLSRARSSNAPTATQRPSWMAASAWRGGDPVPSTTLPPRMTTSSMRPPRIDGCPCNYCPRAMRDALEGKVAIVTGASRGIGAAIAQRFAAEGARVAIVARSLELGSGGHLAGSLRETADVIGADGGVALPVVADLSDPACDRAAIVVETEAEIGPVDVLVNNAAACFYLSIDEQSELRLRVANEVNVVTPYL